MNFDKERIKRKTVEEIKEAMQVVKEEYGIDCACESGEIIKVILKMNKM